MARSSAYNQGEKKAIYCKGINLSEEINWYSPSNLKMDGKSNKNTRVYVERRNESPTETLVALIIHSTKIADTGKWTCKAGELSESIDILVGDKVIIDEKEVSLTGEEGKSVKMECPAKGTPKPVVKWYINNSAIPDNDSKYLMKTNRDIYTLEITNLVHTDAGDYICKVTQKAMSHYTDKRFTLHVQHKPVLISDSPEPEGNAKYRTEEVYAILNETKNISCKAIGNPVPTYEWYKRFGNSYQEVIDDEDKVVKTPEESVLILRVYNESDLGQYKCTVANNRGSVSIIFDVNQGYPSDPPDYISLASSNTSSLVFNVSCSTCNMGRDEVTALKARNLPAVAYSFELAPVQEGYPVTWDGALSYEVNIEDPEDTLFLLDPVPSGSYHVRVRTKNAAGYSAWTELGPDPVSTSGASSLNAFRTYFFLICLVATLS